MEVQSLLFVFCSVLLLCSGEQTQINTLGCGFSNNEIRNDSLKYVNSTVPLDEENDTCVNRTGATFDLILFLEFNVILPIAVFGVCGNVLILVVWSAESAFRPTTFFMKCLSVSDIVFLFSIFFHTAIFSHSGGTVVNTLLSVFVVCWFRILTTHTTLAVVFTRWLAVYMPLKVNSLLTRRRVVLGYILLILWCVTASVPLALISTEESNVNTDFTLINVTDVVYLALPIVSLIVLNVHIVCILRSRHSRLGHGQSTVARASDSSQHNRLLAAVVCLSVTTVLAYPLGVVCRIFLNAASMYGHSPTVHRVLWTSAVLEAINSSINVVYYLAFVSTFRQLFCRRCCCCFSCWKIWQQRSSQS